MVFHHLVVWGDHPQNPGPDPLVPSLVSLVSIGNTWWSTIPWTTSYKLVILMQYYGLQKHMVSIQLATWCLWYASHRFHQHLAVDTIYHCPVPLHLQGSPIHAEDTSPWDRDHGVVFYIYYIILSSTYINIYIYIYISSLVATGVLVGTTRLRQLETWIWGVWFLFGYIKMHAQCKILPFLDTLDVP